MHLERKTREAELLTARLVDESERRAAEADRLKDELLKARLAEKQAKEKLLEFLSRNAYNNITVSSLAAKDAEAMFGARKKVCVEVNTEKTEYVWMSCHQTAEQNHYLKVANKSFRISQCCKIWE